MTVPAPGQDNPQANAIIKAHNDAMMALAADVEPYSKSAIDAHEQTIRDNLSELLAALKVATRDNNPHEGCPGCEVCELAEELIEAREENARLAAALEAATRERDEWKRHYEEARELSGDDQTRADAAERALEAARDALRHVRPYVSDGDFDPPDEWLANAVSKIDAALDVSASTEDKT